MTDIQITDAAGKVVILTPPLLVDAIAAPVPGPVPPTPTPEPQPPAPTPAPTPVGKWPVPAALVGLPVLNDYGFTDTFPALTGNAEAKMGAWTIQPNAASRQQDPSEPISPPTVLQMDYKTGFASGSAPSNAWFTFPSLKKEIYVGFSWKCNAGWQGEPSNVNKLLFLYMAGTRQALVPEMYGPPGGPFRLRTALFELGPAQVQPWADANAAGALIPGTWYRIGIHCVVKPGQTGILRQYVNDALVTDLANVAYDPKGFDSASINPTWGGNTAGAVKKQNDYFRYGHITILGK